MPACPGMPQIVPAKPRPNLRPLECTPPSLRGHLCDGTAAIRKHPPRVFALVAPHLIGRRPSCYLVGMDEIPSKESMATLLPIMGVVFVAFLIIGMAMPVLPLHVHQGLGLSMFVVGLVAGSQFAVSLLSRVWPAGMSTGVARSGPSSWALSRQPPLVSCTCFRCALWRTPRFLS